VEEQRPLDDIRSGVLSRPEVIALEHPAFTPVASGRRLRELHAVCAAGEATSLSFSLRAGDGPLDVTLAVCDAESQSSGLPSIPLDLYRVHLWEQAGIGLYQSRSRRVAELLLKSENEPLADAYERSCGHSGHFHRRGNYYVPPNVRLQGEVHATLKPDEPHQFWLSAKIPGDALPALYSGTISITSPGTRSIEPIPICIEVRPVRLMEPAQDLFLWYKGTLDCRRPQHYVSERIMRAQLQDIYDHGFTSISLIEALPEYLQPALEIANEVGFHRNVLLEGPFHRGYRKLKFGNLHPIYYLSDKLDVPRFAFSTRHHFRNWRFAQAAKSESMCSLMRQEFSRRLLDDHDIGHAPGIFNFYLPTNLDYFRAHAAFPELRNHKTYYYWQCHMEKPNLHRVLAGLFLWKTKADGIAPYCYQHRPRFPNSAFNDFDEWEPGYFFGPERRPFKDHMTTYPAAEGSIPTVQWKGLSAGLFDLRYLATLEAALAKAAASGDQSLMRDAQEVQGEVDRFLNRISLHTITILDDQDPEPYAGIHAEEYAQFRTLMSQALVDLQPRAEELS